MKKLTILLSLGLFFTGCASMDNDYSMLSDSALTAPQSYVLFDAKIENLNVQKKGRFVVKLKPETGKSKKSLTLKANEVVAWAVEPGTYRLLPFAIGDGWSSNRLFQRSDEFSVGDHEIVYIGQLNMKMHHPDAEGVMKNGRFWADIAVGGTGNYGIEHELDIVDNMDAIQKQLEESMGEAAASYTFKKELVRDFERCRTVFC